MVVSQGCAGHHYYSSTDRKDEGWEQRTTELDGHFVTMWCRANDSGETICRGLQ
jgi:hypothetical protein